MLKNYKIDPGELDKRISILSPEREKDAAGYYTEQRPVLWECWAKVEHTSVSEMQRNNADYAETKIRILIRKPPADIELHRKMLVQHEGHDYEIIYVNRYGEQYTEILARLLTTAARVD